jgi:hypothetical protein
MDTHQQQFDFTAMTPAAARSIILHFPFRNRGYQATWDGEPIFLNCITDEEAVGIAGEMALAEGGERG